MADGWKALTGPAVRSYFRALFETTPGLPAETARRLTLLCAREIAQVRVRRPLSVRARKGEPQAGAATGEATIQPDRPLPRPPFDPFAFSLIVVLRREGEAALLRRLEAIGTVAELKAVADAQHIVVPEGACTPDELRAALVKGARERIADRLAAAG
jgi:hypothetical protein